MPRFFWVHQEALRLKMVYPGVFRAQQDTLVDYEYKPRFADHMYHFASPSR